ncbi:MAG: transcriptional repressor [Anaerolineales bacterium]|nr:transcriptional repressor [Anaerolineales bacterium]
MDVRIRSEQLVQKLRDQGYRLTPQRLALVDLIARSEGHPNAAQLYDRLRRRFPTTSPATVYKLLALLKELGEVCEIDFHDDSHYDGNRPEPHPHLICIKCRKIVDGTMDLDPEWVRRMENKSGYRIERHQLTIFGVCPECRK